MSVKLVAIYKPLWLQCTCPVVLYVLFFFECPDDVDYIGSLAKVL